MQIDIEPTDELYEFPAIMVDGTLQHVKARIWRGWTERGIEIEAYVLSVSPVSNADFDEFKDELPEFMRATREFYPTGKGE